MRPSQNTIILLGTDLYPSIFLVTIQRSHHLSSSKSMESIIPTPRHSLRLQGLLPDSQMHPLHLGQEVSSSYIESSEFEAHGTYVYPPEDSTQLYNISVVQGYLDPLHYLGDPSFMDPSFLQEEPHVTLLHPYFPNLILTRIPTSLRMPGYHDPFHLETHTMSSLS